MKKTAVVIPIYRSNLTVNEELSLRQTISVLHSHDIYAASPPLPAPELERICHLYGKEIGKKLFPQKYFKSAISYSNLLKRREFYEAFTEYECILIVQLDAMVFSDQLDSWCDYGYSYIGAPWVKVENGKLVYKGVGNGGFSLRRVHDCLRFLSKPRYLQNPVLEHYYRSRLNPHHVLMRCLHRYVFSWNMPALIPRVIEDVFWGILAPVNDTEFIVPGPEKAIKFAFECEPERMFEENGGELPFGCHAWEKYGSEFWSGVFQKIGIMNKMEQNQI